MQASFPPGFLKTVNEALLGVDGLPVQAALPGYRALSAVQSCAGLGVWLLILLMPMAVLQERWVLADLLLVPAVLTLTLLVVLSLFADLLLVPAVLTLTLLAKLLLVEVVLLVAEAGTEMLLAMPWKLQA